MQNGYDDVNSVSFWPRRFLYNDFQMTVTEDYCVSGKKTKALRNSPLVGSMSLDSSPVKTFTNIQLTSLVSTRADEHTVIIATTSTGRLIKVHSQSRHVAFVS